MARKDRRASRQKRRRRIRAHIMGTPDRPRLSVFRSNKHIYAQLIEDFSGRTLAAASTQDPVLAEELDSGGNVEAARRVGELIARRALEKGIKRVLFDRSGYDYHGRVATLAEAARKEGLEF